MSNRIQVRLVAAAWWGTIALLIPGAALGQSENPGELASGGTSEIVGGTTVATCAWPSVGFLGGCTATLIHPRVITTAAHCSPRNGQQVRFGEKSPWAFTISATKC